MADRDSEPSRPPPRPPPRQVITKPPSAPPSKPNSRRPSNENLAPSTEAPNPFRAKLGVKPAHLATSAGMAQLRRQNSTAGGLRRQNSVAGGGLRRKESKRLNKPERREQAEKKPQTQYVPLLRPANFAPPTARQGATTAHYMDVLPSNYLMTASADVLDEPPVEKKEEKKQDASQTAGKKANEVRLTKKDKPQSRPRIAEDLEMRAQAGPWYFFCRIVTGCFTPGMLLLMGLDSRAVQQAWREKVTLCLIAVAVSIGVAFASFTMQGILCPRQQQTQGASEFHYSWFNETSGTRMKSFRSGITVKGTIYNFSDAAYNIRVHSGILVPSDYVSADLSNLFRDYKRIPGAASSTDYCAEAAQGYYQYALEKAANVSAVRNTSGSFEAFDCGVSNPFALDYYIGGPRLCADYRILKNVPPVSPLYYSWTDIAEAPLGTIKGVGLYASNVQNVVVYGDHVMEISSYLESPFFPDEKLTVLLNTSIGRDISLSYGKYQHPSAKAAMQCLLQKYTVGFIEQRLITCIVSDTITYALTALFFGLLGIKFAVSVAYRWMEAPAIIYGVGTVGSATKSRRRRPSTLSAFGSTAELMDHDMNRSFMPANELEECDDPFVVCMVTCYSEGERTIRSTLDSVALSDYHDYRKLLFVVCDGIVTGSGERRPTSDILVSLVNESRDLPAEAKAYLAIGRGAKQRNVARVHAGFYSPQRGRNVPIIVVIKVGASDEQGQSKPGNRGKRDSQMILINFLSKVLFDDAMTPLEHDLYRKTTIVTGVTPDMFELVMTVDADTRLRPDAMRYVVQAMKNDTAVMGCCGETQVSNKYTSWVTMMQVWEYYISHAFGKGFESFFGCVTCLPGCFSMYRIKALMADGRWVPILCSPEIADEYSETEVHTLHTKNLLLLGEDRFLTTLLLRAFPKRKTLFVPQAICETKVPSTFSVLLSQRRRWINSTVHNLFELMRVSELCGVFCFSMQFVIFMDLIGTFASPAMLIFSLYFIVQALTTANPTFVPLIGLAVMMGLPAAMIPLSDIKRFPMLIWLFVYMLFYWVFNCVLPLYAFWHFDDFTWGETRKLAGLTDGLKRTETRKLDERRDAVPLKRFVEWEQQIEASREVLEESPMSPTLENNSRRPSAANADFAQLSAYAAGRKSSGVPVLAAGNKRGSNSDLASVLSMAQKKGASNATVADPSSHRRSASNLDAAETTSHRRSASNLVEAETSAHRRSGSNLPGTLETTSRNGRSSNVAPNGAVLLEITTAATKRPAGAASTYNGTTTTGNKKLAAPEPPVNSRRAAPEPPSKSTKPGFQR